MDNREAEIIKERRRELKMSQQETALNAGIHLQQYQKFESGPESFLPAVCL